jgi:RimJ/RimL family protein N-acetyltransferase
MDSPEALEVDLRPWAEGDLDLLIRLLGDPAMTEHLGGPEPLEKIHARHQRYCAESQTEPYRLFAILAGSERTPAGWVGYWEAEENGEPAWEMGWSVLPEFQGRGLASQAARMVVERVRAEGKHRFLYAYPAAGNGPSNAICRKVGFTWIEEGDFEYPKGSFMRCNVWRMALDHGIH